MIGTRIRYALETLLTPFIIFGIILQMAARGMHEHSGLDDE